jgi:hypothetical protein
VEKIVTKRQIARDRGIARSRNFEQEGKLTSPFPIEGQLDITGIQLDEIERQVIECRPELINSLTNQDSNSGRRVGGKVELLLSVRLFHDQVRVVSDVLGDALLDRLDV